MYLNLIERTQNLVKFRTLTYVKFSYVMINIIYLCLGIYNPLFLNYNFLNYLYN